ncbi:UDP-glucose dehydrogenase family protein [Desulfobacca acetoxidans]|uniref:UDP-glucose 6-dehydrogenase n=1 Tax=Desulfobacca acetoxidans (strain ATCC 700848 / DSM 11109 / ASRB2) TaxID=880072 RepID=F2NJ39_DESAR|nr:UDP-glucose/GDP-mannose dehydrogenase family protein [Desulfobacca acetoxidans]AEB07997.1 nucleotide sugar dehydrogenase [Desulfobacca acetoxidans DSM 11109]
MKLAMIGVGYVGLVTGACFAQTGHEVICMDIDSKKIEGLRKNEIEIPIYEPGLKDYVKLNVAAGRLSFTTDLNQAVSQSQVIFICVGTPSREDGSADLRYVYEVARSVGQTMQEYKIVVDKSTVPVGTAARVRQLIAKELARRGTNLTFDVVSNPEFLREGSAIDDFMRPDRIVVGVESPEAERIMQELYKPWTDGKFELFVMEVPSAEMTKYAANSFLATKISFINEIANLCALTGANIKSVQKGMGSDKRIGPHFLYPGLGYGGSCFPKDVKALVYIAQTLAYNFKILEATEIVNQAQRHRFILEITRYFQNNLEGKKLALWGLAFKPETDDIREAPSLTIIERLLEMGAELSVHDPEAMKEVQFYFRKHANRDRITYADLPEAALPKAEALIINTEWEVYKNAELNLIKSRMKNPVVFDGRNIYDPAKMREMGFTYFFVG